MLNFFLFGGQWADIPFQNSQPLVTWPGKRPEVIPKRSRRSGTFVRQWCCIVAEPVQPQEEGVVVWNS